MSKKFWFVIIGIIVIAFVSWDLTSHNSSTASNNGADVVTSNASGAVTAPASVVKELSAVPQTILDKIGVGSADAEPTAISGKAIYQNNKPEIFYEGAEYCPYCATERWAITVALDRFGSFTNLKLTHSSTQDVYPNTQTLSFYGSTYTSPYISFVPVELDTNIPSASGSYTTLQTPTNEENSLTNEYDKSGSIPFIYFAGKYEIQGATYNPSLLSGKTAEQIASSLANSNSAIAKGVDGAANTITAGICGLTNNKPATACDSTIKSIESQLK